jgi:hypothetical protein
MIADFIWRKLPVVVVVPDEAAFVFPDVKPSFERGLCAGCARIDSFPVVGTCRLDLVESDSAL